MKTILAALFLCLTTLSLCGQADLPTLKLSTTVVSVPVVVHDELGHIVHGLHATDFELKEGHTKEQIRYFSEDAALPLTLVLMVDTSGSTRKLQRKESEASAEFFTSMLTRPNDRAALVQFDTNIRELHPMTHDAAQLNAALAHLAEPHPPRFNPGTHKAQGGTLLYDGLCSAAENLLALQPAGRKAIVVLTDGVDSGSKLTVGQAVDCVQRTDTAVYSMLYSSEPADDNNGGWLALKTLAQATGGRAFEVDHHSPVTRYYAAIADDLHSQYLLGYVPEDLRPGKYHSLEVKPLLTHLLVQARSGYYAARNSPSSPLPVPASLATVPPLTAPQSQTTAPEALAPANKPPPAQTAPVASGQAYDYWPNPASHTNSDAWLREHHAQIAVLKPRVLVIVADNHANIALVQAFVKEAVAAAAEGSRYHGYSDPGAKPQLQYQIAAIADLRDDAAARWPKVWPVHLDDKGKPEFDYEELFGPELAQALGIRDPDDPDKVLNVRQLFEKGVVNEIWMVYPEIDGQPDNGIAGLFETKARVQRYDADGKPIPAQLDRCAGNGCLPESRLGRARVTMRFAELNISLGVGCFTHATGHGWEGLWRAIPEFDHASARFFNRNLQAQGLPMDTLYDGCPQERGDCWVYPNDHTITNGPLTKKLPHFRDEHWGEGCGNVHFPPNGRDNYDFEDSRKVLSTCENYGLGNGPNGADKQLPYRFHGKEADPSLPYDCGGAWQLYLRQSFPGFGSGAKNADGTAMKSWWPYLYY